MLSRISNDQKYVLSELINWYFDANKRQYITVGGYAGTGKTTLISLFSKKLKKRSNEIKIAFCSYTGKATQVIKQILKKDHILDNKDFVGTLHSLIYKPIRNNNEEIIGWQRKLVEDLSYDLIIVDEASMLDKLIWHDLLFYKIPVIAIGDHGQLPPINQKFNLMQKSDLYLTEIHRQAKENPIIQLSIMARQTGKIPFGKFSDGVKKYNRQDHDSYEILEELLTTFSKEVMILCGYNFTRVQLNKYIRGLLGYTTEFPTENDRVICLKNNHEKQIFNGMLGNIEKLALENEKFYYAKIIMDDGSVYQGQILKEQFNSKKQLNFSSRAEKLVKVDLFDFGYALTVHKAQGSQASKVILFEERFKQMDDDTWKRWLYTAITRAKNELYIFATS